MLKETYLRALRAEPATVPLQGACRHRYFIVVSAAQCALFCSVQLFYSGLCYSVQFPSGLVGSFWVWSGAKFLGDNKTENAWSSADHSASIAANQAVSRLRPFTTDACRKIPSKLNPSLCAARREALLQASHFHSSRRYPAEKAQRIIRYMASVAARLR